MASLPKIPLVKLNDGTQIPAMGFGTGTVWYKPDRFAPFNPDMVVMAKEVIEAGYRHIDTAEAYGTEAELGQALKESGVPREEFFITTKVINTVTEGSLDDFPKALDESLRRLQTDYVDLYLIHSPYIFNNTYVEADVAAAWKHMEALQRSGKARAIGISNFRRAHVEALLKTAEIKPVVNQIQFSPYVGGAPVYAKWLHDQGIATQSFLNLAPITWFKDKQLAPTLKELAEKYGVGENTVLVRWQLDQGIIVLNTSKKVERLQEYFKALDLKLSEEDATKITTIGQTAHLRIPVPPLYDGGDNTPY